MMGRVFFGFLAFMVVHIAVAADLAAEVKARLAEPALLRGQFEQQKSVAGFRKPLISRGDFLLWRGHGVLWHTRKPFDSTLVLRRDKLSVTQADGRSAYQLDAEREPSLRAVNELLFALFSGDIATLQKYFRLEGALSDKRAWTLVLTPSDVVLMRVFKRVELAGDSYVRQVRLEEANGDSSLIRFDALSEMPAVNPEETQLLGN